MIDLDLSASGVRPVDDSWQAPGMRDSDTVDVELADVAVDERDLRGAPGWYTDRLGFWWGGAGVAAVWLGGALGVLDALRAGLAPQPGHGVEQSRLAHLGALHARCRRAAPCSTRPRPRSTPIRRARTGRRCGPCGRRSSGPAGTFSR